MFNNSENTQKKAYDLHRQYALLEIKTTTKFFLMYLILTEIVSAIYLIQKTLSPVP